MNHSIVPGSVQAVASASGSSIAEAFLGVSIVAIVDTSGSMDTRDSRGMRRRYNVACDELAQLQAAHPGQVGVIAFSDSAEFCPGGIPPFYGGGTDLARALEFARMADGAVRFVVISDGYPDDPQRALKVAATMQSEISTVYVGPEGDRQGAEFLALLAKRKGGQALVAKSADLLSQKVESLLLASG